MSTLAAADLQSDSEGDGDFVPTVRPIKKRKISTKSKSKPKGSGSDSESDSSSSGESNDGDNGDAGEEAKLLKKEQEEREAGERKRKAEEAFAMFRDETASTVAANNDEAGNSIARDMVEVKKERRFAGEVIIDHPDAIAFLSKTTNIDSEISAKSAIQAIQESEASMDIPRPIPDQSTTAQNPPMKPQSKGPIKRKPRQTLEQLSAGLTGGKKMTTLEKSQMDWKSHVASSSNVADELASNRRSGGFLEKRDFLERVGDRRTETLDNTKKGGR